MAKPNFGGLLSPAPPRESLGEEFSIPDQRACPRSPADQIRTFVGNLHLTNLIT